jgi:hypothetical protein
VGLPLVDLLGGRVRDRIKVYNTCAGYSYVQTKPTQGTHNFGLDAKKGEYEDLDAFLHRADELALSLLEQGITAMKIWPFDYAAERSQGYWISASELKEALAPFEKIRKAVGDRMEVAAEGGPGVHGPHGLHRRGGAGDRLPDRGGRDARRTRRLPRAAGAGGAGHGHHGCDVVRRRQRSPQDLQHGGGLARSGGLP